MGLDQYMYARARQPAPTPDNCDGPRVDLGYRRKHPHLQGWMAALWEQKGNPGQDPDYPQFFNGIELELTEEDLDRLEADVLAGTLPSTEGFFFGSDSDQFYKADDLAFIREARAQLFLGLQVFYNSSW